MLGERRENEALMERALAAYNAALTVRTRQTTPVEWANTLAQKGISLQTLGHRRKDIDLTKEAIAAYRAALTVRTPEDNLLAYAITQTNLGNALSTLGWLKEDKSILKEAPPLIRCRSTPSPRQTTRGKSPSLKTTAGKLKSGLNFWLSKATHPDESRRNRALA